VHFLTGLDEHGTKVQQRRRRRGFPRSSSWTRWSRSSAPFARSSTSVTTISSDTTQPRHKKIVQECLQRLYERARSTRRVQGLLQRPSGAVRDEKERLPDGSWPEVYGAITEIVEPNYYFAFPSIRTGSSISSPQRLRFPKFRQKQVVEFLKDPINDLCISRPKNRLEWGIELPFDSNFVTTCGSTPSSTTRAVGMFQRNSRNAGPRTGT
jgi:methionyl-tRNA synthetase